MKSTEHDPRDVYRVLFVYGKGGRVKCLTLDEAKRDEAELIAGGWVHTATIQPARWIECLVNDEGAAIGKMDVLRWG